MLNDREGFVRRKLHLSCVLAFNGLGIALIVSVVILLVPVLASAQYSDSLMRREHGWIESMSKEMGFKLSASNDWEAFTVAADGFNPELYPNTSTILKLSYNYRFLSFGINYAPSVLPGNNDNELKGKTSNFGISLGFIHTHWFTQLEYSHNKGYYLRNSDDFSDDWQPGDPYLQFPNLVVNSVEGLTGYSFNERFSVRALTTQTERQLKSTGTFVPVVGYRFYSVNNLTESSGQKTGNFEFILGAGYHYTFVFKSNFYASLGLTPAVGYIFTRLTTRGQLGSPEDIISYGEAPIARIEGRCAAGYNARRFFAGFLIEMKASTFEQENTTAINTDTYVFYQVFVGFRMKAPSRLKKSLEKIPLG